MLRIASLNTSIDFIIVRSFLKNDGAGKNANPVEGDYANRSGSTLHRSHSGFPRVRLTALHECSRVFPVFLPANLRELSGQVAPNKPVSAGYSDGAAFPRPGGR